MERFYPRLTEEGRKSLALGFSQMLSANHKSGRFEHLIHPVINTAIYNRLGIERITHPWACLEIRENVKESAQFAWFVIKMGDLIPPEAKESTPIKIWEETSSNYVSNNPQHFKETVQEAELNIASHYEEKITKRLELLEEAQKLGISIDGMKNKDAATLLQQALAERLELEKEARIQRLSVREEMTNEKLRAFIAASPPQIEVLPEALPKLQKAERTLQKGRQIESTLQRNALIVAALVIAYIIYFAGRDS